MRRWRFQTNQKHIPVGRVGPHIHVGPNNISCMSNSWNVQNRYLKMSRNLISPYYCPTSALLYWLRSGRQTRGSHITPGLGIMGPNHRGLKRYMAYIGNFLEFSRKLSDIKWQQNTHNLFHETAQKFIRQGMHHCTYIWTQWISIIIRISSPENLYSNQNTDCYIPIGIPPIGPNHANCWLSFSRN